jgi:outer membrane protein TolC
VIDANLKVIEQRVKDIDNLEKNGLATNSDLLRVKLQQSNTELLKIEANNILQSANFNFNQLIGLQPNTIIVIDTANMFEERNAGNSDAYMNSALDKRPELQSIALRTKAAEDNLKNAKNNLWPVVNAGANFYFASPNQRYVPPTDVFHQTWDVGVNLNWDITTLFTNKHVVAENKAIVSLSNATTGQLSDAVKSDVYQNYLAYTESLEKLIVLKKAVEQAEENLRITNSMYRNNLAIISDLTDAQSFQLQAAINMVIAKADNQISYFKLLKSSGDF